MNFKNGFLVFIPLVLLIGWKCSGSAKQSGFTAIPFPEDNPMTPEKIAFGKRLFFDKRLSRNNKISCASCHKPDLAFTDGLPKSIGVNGSEAMRNAPSLYNTAYFKAYMYDGEVKTLEQQVLVPIQDHLEMGNSMKEVLRKLSKDTDYNRLAKKLFNRELDAYVITRAISTFERSLISRNSRFDRYKAGDKKAMNAEEIAGWNLFSEKLYCTSCHSGPDLTNHRVLSNGLYADYGEDQGRYRIHGNESEKGAFKVPSLRNVSLTAPYMHDGSIPTLEGVIKHYSKGGNMHPNQSPLIKPFDLNDLELKQLEAFLKTLVDTSYVN